MESHQFVGIQGPELSKARVRPGTVAGGALWLAKSANNGNSIFLAHRFLLTMFDSFLFAVSTFDSTLC
jgi:hypothetical protein